MTAKDKKHVGIWLLVGAFMVFIQVVIGGITRLTESGLSITQWEVIGGTVPPLTQNDWQEAFSLYKETPEYQKLNKGMGMGEFKFIYFWEYFHRLWARTLGFVFLLPFIYFLIRRKINRSWIKRSMGAFALGGLAGVFGWIMVKSGLQDKPMVSPYRLAIHLGIAITTLSYLLWNAWHLLAERDPLRGQLTGLRNFALVMTVLLCFQILMGALVSGMEAARAYPTWPAMGNSFIPPVLLDAGNWHWMAFINFNKEILPHALVQFIHRNLAYVIVVLAVPFTIRGLKKVPQTASNVTRMGLLVIPALILLQATLGVAILLNTTNEIPVGLGVIHQAMAILLLSAMLFLNYRLGGKVDELSGERMQANESSSKTAKSAFQEA
jgi:cytochrome c oxidase assembly protein subunit 15